MLFGLTVIGTIGIGISMNQHHGRSILLMWWVMFVGGTLIGSNGVSIPASKKSRYSTVVTTKE
jgi:hypothetical protein